MYCHNFFCMLYSPVEKRGYIKHESINSQWAKMGGKSKP